MYVVCTVGCSWRRTSSIADDMVVKGTILLSSLAIALAFDLHLLHTNDMHARFEQTSRESGKCSDQELSERQCYGGFARIRTLVKKERAKVQEGKAPPVLFLNAGDNYQGSTLFTKYGWNITARFINLLEFDALSLGNHEFDNGVTGLVPFINNVSAPIVTANLRLEKEPDLLKSKLLNSTVLTINGVQIGIIGYLTPDTKFLSQSGNVEYEDEIDAIQREATLLRKKGINILIALGHSGWLKDLEIAEKIKDIDIVVGGHTNTFLFTGNDLPNIEKPTDVYPKVVVQNSGRKVLVVQSYAYTKYLGSLYVSFDQNGEIVNHTGNPILIDFSIEEDPTVLQELSIWKQSNAEDLEEIGKTLVYLENSCRSGECNLGNLITDSFIDHVSKHKKIPNNKTWTDSAIAFYHGGGIRAGHDENSGVMIRETLDVILPFNTSILIISVQGRVIMDMLEWSINKYNVVAPSGKFLQMSGIRVVYNPEDQSVVQVLARCRKCRIPTFEPLNMTKHYNIIIPEFIFKGGDAYSFKNVLSVTYLNTSERFVLEEYIKKYSPIYPGLEGRITFQHKRLVRNTSSQRVSSKILLFLMILVFYFN